MTEHMTERPTGPEVWRDLKRRAPAELSDWYDVGFYQRIFDRGSVEKRLKELLRLKLSKTQGCFT
jgi:hypothetical protein